MPQYYDNEEFDFEANADFSDADRPGCYPKPYPPCPPAQAPSQVAGAQTQQQPQANLLYCMPVGQVAGAQAPSLVAGAQSPYNASPYGGFGGYPYPFYGGFGYGWIWAVVIIIFILLIIGGFWWWSCYWR
ncbi:hypothetical protein ACSVDE_12880 [Pseudalkalibacillus sp. Hm43]|uniref:hypothetical protein n=1 Tax=Pseudalkalibacillus sp. Hm43 TaxID=3450742 RepID=UPI003F427272